MSVTAGSTRRRSARTVLDARVQGSRGAGVGGAAGAAQLRQALPQLLFEHLHGVVPAAGQHQRRRRS